MDEDLDGGPADPTEGREGVACRLGVEAEDGVTPADHNERLGTHAHTHARTRTHTHTQWL